MRALSQNVLGLLEGAAGSPAVPVCLKMKNVPSTRPTSPTTLMTKALMPASVAVVRRYQKEISR